MPSNPERKLEALSYVANGQRIGHPLVEAGAPDVHGPAPSGGRVSSVYNEPRRAGINETSFAHTFSIQKLNFGAARLGKQ